MHVHFEMVMSDDLYDGCHGQSVIVRGFTHSLDYRNMENQPIKYLSQQEVVLRTITIIALEFHLRQSAF